MTEIIIDQDLRELRRRFEREYEEILTCGDGRIAEMYHHAMEKLVNECNTNWAEAFMQLNRTPVSIDEFLDNPDYLGGKIEIWDSLRDTLRRMNPDVLVGEEPVHECLLGGATGVGKTTLATATLAYQVYLFSCFQNPQALFGLAPATPIVFVIQSVSRTIAGRVIYQPFRTLFESMPYAQQHLSWNRCISSRLEIEGNLIVTPELANVQATLGQAVAGGILDEANFMTVVPQSTRVPGPRGDGGRFDQAEEVYRGLSRRRKSRFTTQGLSLGSLCVISSTRYRGDFLDRRIREVDELGEDDVVVVRHKQYEVVPQDRFSGETFRLLVGDDRNPTRVLDDGEDPPPEAQIEVVPVEYLTDFRRDPENALRDIVGIAADSLTPFLAQRQKIIEAFDKGWAQRLHPWVDHPIADLSRQGMPVWIRSAMPEPEDRGVPRFIHVDLSLNHDTCGIAIVRVAGMVHSGLREGSSAVETQPEFVVEQVIGLQPSRARELDIAELRSFLVQLRTDFGFNIRLISYDGYQSVESIQMLRGIGIQSWQTSVDRTSEPYQHLRSALYDGRIAVMPNDDLQEELMKLEYLAEQDRVDHPPRGSKDLADAVCAAVYEAGQSRPVRAGRGFYDTDGAPVPRQSRSRPPTINRPETVNRPQGRERPAGRRTRPMSLREQRLERDRRNWQKRFETYVEYEKSRDDVEDEC